MNPSLETDSELDELVRRVDPMRDPRVQANVGLETESALCLLAPELDRSPAPRRAGRRHRGGVPVEQRTWTAQLRERASGRGRSRVRLVTGATAMVAAAAVAAALFFSATTSTPPAYAVITHPNGTITITLREVATGIPAINAKLHKLGYDTAVLPITAHCNTVSGSERIVMHPDPHYEYDGSVTMTYTPSLKRHPAVNGTHYVLAAKQLANGKILAFIGAPSGRTPTCLSYSSTPSNSLIPTFVAPTASPGPPGGTATTP